MRRVPGPISRCLAAAACVALVSTGALAVPVKPAGPKTVPITIPLSHTPLAATAWSPADERYEARRHWKRHRHHDRIDGGDLLVGLLVLGGVAAVAGAIDKSGDEQRERRDGADYPQRPYDYRGEDAGREDWRGRERSSAGEQDRAVDACSAEASRSGRIDEIYEVEKIDGEWRVRGDYESGSEFTCSVDANGRARVGTEDQASNSDWNARGGEDFADVADAAPQARVGADAGEGGDDRYATGQAPDFEDPRGR